MRVENIIKLYDDEDKIIFVNDYVVVRVNNMKKVEYRGKITSIKTRGINLILDNDYSMIILLKNIISLEWRSY